MTRSNSFISPSTTAWTRGISRVALRRHEMKGRARVETQVDVQRFEAGRATGQARQHHRTESGLARAPLHEEVVGRERRPEPGNQLGELRVGGELLERGRPGDPVEILEAEVPGQTLPVGRRDTHLVLQLDTSDGHEIALARRLDAEREVRLAARQVEVADRRGGPGAAGRGGLPGVLPRRVRRSRTRPRAVRSAGPRREARDRRVERRARPRPPTPPSGGRARRVARPPASGSSRGRSSGRAGTRGALRAERDAG